VKQGIQELARLMRKKYPKLSAKEIAIKISETHPELVEGVTERTLYDYCKLSNMDSDEEPARASKEKHKESHWWDDPDMSNEDKEQKTRDLELVISASSQNAYYDWDEEQYLFELFTAGKPLTIFDIPFNQVQSMIEGYVYSGKGLNQKQTCRMMFERYDRKLTHDYFKKILRALGVDKNSTPFAPHRFKTDSQNEQADDWREKQEAELEIFERATAAEYWKKRAKQLAKDIFNVQTYLENLPKLDVVINASPLDAVTPQDPNREFKPIICLADWHGGKWVELDFNHFNMEILADRMRDFENRLVDQIYMHAKLGVVNEPQWLVLGDMLDGPMGDMHPQQGIHQDIHNDEQVEAVHLLLLHTILRVEKRIEKLVKHSGRKKSVGAVPGNHGRSTRDRRDDPVRVIERVVYKWTASHMPDHEWTLPEPAQDRYINLIDPDKRYQITVWHGDEGPKDWRSILFHHRNLLVDHHLLVHGHLHRFEYTEDRHGVCVGVGSPVGIEDYGHNQFAGGGRPQQLLIMFEKDRGFYIPGQIIL
jgi:hypothetical protein